MKQVIFYFFVIPFFISSCVVNNFGNVSSGPLLNINDKYVDIASGQSESSSYFWISGNYNNKLILTAKEDLFRNRPLRTGEYYSNFSCDISKKLILGLIHLTKVTVSAEVLKIDESKNNEITDSTLKPINKSFSNVIGQYHPKTYFKNVVDSFSIAETVYYKKRGDGNFEPYEITSIDGLNVCIKSVFNSGVFINVAQSDIQYSTKKPLNDYFIGEAVEVMAVTGSYKAKILASSDTKVLVYAKDNSESYIVTSPSKLKKLK